MTVTVIIMILGVILDQVSKLIVSDKLISIGTYPLIENILHFTYVENRGAAFGMLADHRWIFMLLSTAAIIVMLVWLFIEKPKSLFVRLAVAFIVAGGVGNMIDRVRLGYVVDFIDCRFIDFYVFNVADSFVCIGCGMLLVGVIYSEIVEQRKKKSGEVADGGNADE